MEQMLRILNELADRSWASPGDWRCDGGFLLFRGAGHGELGCLCPEPALQGAVSGCASHRAVGKEVLELSRW